MKHPILGLTSLFAATSLQATTVLIDNTTQNGSFEDPASGKVMFVSGTIPSWDNWSEIDTSDNDTGTDGAWAGTQNGLDGSRIAFLQPGSAIVNMTPYLIQAGDVISYSFWNSLEGRASAAISLVWDNAGTRTEIAGTSISADAGFQGVGQYTILPGDPSIGSALGVGLASGGNWPEVDQVALSIVPEPGTLTLLALSGIGLIRRKRA